MRILSLIILPVLAFLLVSFATDSPHGDKFKVSCNVCHSPSSWKLDKASYAFDHNTTAMPLTGSHRETNCRSCHISLVFSEAKTGCIDCHADMHENTTGPDCARCHTPKTWIVENITALHRQSRFPLVGPHVTAECSQCHKSASLLRFEPQGIECIDCHQANYYATTKPNHVQSGMSTNCVECHTLNSFDWNYNGSNLNHSFFPLTAGHAINECNRCHTAGTYTGLSPECVSCHQDNYNQTTNPNHAAAQYPTTCNQCHSTNPGWKPATFDHTQFPLTSGHALTDCNLCHINGNYSNTSSECVSCHQDNYNQTTNPDHAAAQYPTTCNQCHSTNPGWKPATFDHTQFPLTSGHALTDCNLCHVNGNYTNTSPECVSCHQDNYNQTTNPDHAAAQYPTTCNQCHSTNPGWKPATFDHTQFPLTSGHALTDCNLCHVNGNYTNTSPECVSCHQADYNQTTNPNHSAANISTACATCHTTNPDWKPASFTIHDAYFPIYSGKHNGEWNSCADCHTNTANWASFTCISCHEHNQTSMNDKHSGINGYSWDSQACFSCHPTGRAED